MIIDCKTISENLRNTYKQEIKQFSSQPQLIVIMVGENEASARYVKNKEKACNEVSIRVKTDYFKEATTKQLIETIEIYNQAKNVNGIMVQLPLPSNINADKVINSIDPNKDVDGLTDVNIARLWTDKKGFIPCTPKGVIKILDSINFKYEGSDVAVLGRSNIVGKPMAKLLMDRGCTVAICHSKTRNRALYTSNADLIISAVGKENTLDKFDLSFDHKKQIIIDVGINKDMWGNICGDINKYNKYFDMDAEHTIYDDPLISVTPVPGGVGPMTITMLLENTIEAYKLQNNI